MAFRRSILKVFIVLLVLGGLFAVGFAGWWFTQKPVYILAATEHNQHLEDYLPAHGNFFIAIDRSDLNLNSAITKVSGKTTDQLMKLLADSLIADQQMSRELATELSEAHQFVVGGFAPFFNLNNELAKNPSGANENSADLAQDYRLRLAFEVKDPEKVKMALRESLSQSKDKTQISFATVGNVLVISSGTQSELDAELAVPTWKHTSIGYNKELKTLVEKLPENRFGAFYLDETANSEARSDSKADTKKGEDGKEDNAQGNLFAQSRVLISMSAAEQGISFKAITDILSPKGAQEKMIQIANTPHEELLPRVPTNGVLIASEGYNAAGGFEIQPGLVLTMKNLLAVDFEKELKPVLSGATAFVMADAGGILPSLSIFSEVSDATAAAPLISKLDQVLGAATTYANFMFKTNSADGPFVDRTPVLADGITASSVTAHAERASPDAQLPPLLINFAKTFRLTYGTAKLSNTTVFFISTNPTVLQDLRNTALLGKGLEPLSIYTAGLVRTNTGATPAQPTYSQKFYMNVDILGAFIARAITQFERATADGFAAPDQPAGTTSASGPMQQVGESIQKALAPFDAFYAASYADSELILGDALLQLKK